MDAFRRFLVTMAPKAFDPFKGKGRGYFQGLNPPGEALRGVRPQTFGPETLPEGKGKGFGPETFPEGKGKGKMKGKDFYNQSLPMTLLLSLSGRRAFRSTRPTLILSFLERFLIWDGRWSSFGSRGTLCRYPSTRTVRLPLLPTTFRCS